MSSSIDTDSSTLSSVDRHQPGVGRHKLPDCTNLRSDLTNGAYIPKVSFPAVPRHLLKPISAEKLADFNKMVKRIPLSTSFEDACETRPVYEFFNGCRETKEEIEELFIKARNSDPSPTPSSSTSPLPSLIQLEKAEDPGKFEVPVSISGVRFDDSFCDSGSGINLMSRAVAQQLGIVDFSPSRISLEFADSSTKSPQGFIPDLIVQIGNHLIPTDFQVVEMRGDETRPLILGRPFMATVGAVVDCPNKRVCFRHIDKNVFYRVVPPARAITRIPCTTIQASEAQIEPKQQVTMPTPDKPTVPKTTHPSKTDAAKVQSKRIKGDPRITLTPTSCVGDVIEYKIKRKGTSSPFSKVRAILTPAFSAKGEEAVNAMKSRILMLQLIDKGACSKASSSAPTS